ncbi:MAG: hypothetical protein IJV43_05290 [Oscillospiraceae bacterium]|nr:hypothetical protein [Oscillospiraceae bacterium]
MGAVLGVLSTVTGVISGVLSLVVDILGEFGVLLFIGGFFGLLVAFLWFFFRYLDKKRLTLPTIVFMLFFVIFLGGNILIIAQDARTRDAEPAQIESSAAEAGADIAVV